MFYVALKNRLFCFTSRIVKFKFILTARVVLLSVPKPPYIYLEVVSRDSWNRFRSEGFTFKALPVFQPGRHDFQLACVRIRPGNLTGNLRRFFIGDFMSCGDFNWFGLPKDHQVMIACVLEKTIVLFVVFLSRRGRSSISLGWKRSKRGL